MSNATQPSPPDLEATYEAVKRREISIEGTAMQFAIIGAIDLIRSLTAQLAAKDEEIAQLRAKIITLEISRDVRDAVDRALSTPTPAEKRG